jgi:hypothetical protein
MIYRPGSEHAELQTPPGLSRPGRSNAKGRRPISSGWLGADNSNSWPVPKVDSADRSSAKGKQDVTSKSADDNRGWGWSGQCIESVDYADTPRPQQSSFTADSRPLPTPQTSREILTAHNAHKRTCIVCNGQQQSSSWDAPTTDFTLSSVHKKLNSVSLELQAMILEQKRHQTSTNSVMQELHACLSDVREIATDNTRTGAQRDVFLASLRLDLEDKIGNLGQNMEQLKLQMMGQSHSYGGQGAEQPSADDGRAKNILFDEWVGMEFRREEGQQADVSNW